MQVLSIEVSSNLLTRHTTSDNFNNVYTVARLWYVCGEKWVDTLIFIACMPSMYILRYVLLLYSVEIEVILYTVDDTTFGKSTVAIISNTLIIIYS